MDPPLKERWAGVTISVIWPIRVVQNLPTYRRVIISALQDSVNRQFASYAKTGDHLGYTQRQIQPHTRAIY